MNDITHRRRYGRSAPSSLAALLVALMTWPHVAVADSLHMRDCTPAADTIIHGRHAEYVVRFDGPVDHLASRLEIVQSGRVVQSLTPLADSAVDVLFASSETPPAGSYQLRWQARSPADGTVSMGSVPFSVAP